MYPFTYSSETLRLFVFRDWQAWAVRQSADPTEHMFTRSTSWPCYDELIMTDAALRSAETPHNIPGTRQRASAGCRLPAWNNVTIAHLLHLLAS